MSYNECPEEYSGYENPPAMNPLPKPQSNTSLVAAKEFVSRAIASGFTPKAETNWIVWPGNIPKDLFKEMLAYNPDVLAKAVSEIAK